MRATLTPCDSALVSALFAAIPFVTEADVLSALSHLLGDRFSDKSAKELRRRAIEFDRRFLYMILA